MELDWGLEEESQKWLSKCLNEHIEISSCVFAAVGYHGFYLGFEGKYQLYLHFSVRLHS